MPELPDRSAEIAHGLSIEQLLTAVENELIPRLLVSHAAELEAAPEPSIPPPEGGAWTSRADIVRFAEWSAAGEAASLREHVSGLLSSGVGLDSIYLHLFAPAARHLGDCWLRDEISFVDVQLGLCELHQIVCDCGPVGFRRKPGGEARSILLGVAPGEQHTFGITLAAEFFRRNGWQVSNLSGLEPEFIVERVASTHYTAAGFSLFGETCLDGLVSIIAEVRRRTCNPDLMILVGGDYFARHPDMVATVGADLSGSDAHRAVELAERALDGMTTTA